MSIEIKLNTKSFDKAAEKFPGRLFKKMKPKFRLIGDIFLQKFIQPGRTGKPGVKMRTGALARSFNRSVIGTGLKDLVLFIFTDSKYARIHEKGGTITPKKSRYLAIPLDAAKTSAGVSRYSSPREVPGIRYGGVSAAGNPILRNLEGTPLYVLVQSVRIKKRLGMFKTWDNEIPKTVRILNTAVGEVLERF